jgi:anti-sigma factor RsiW
MAYADDLISSDPKRLAKAEERLHDDPEAAARVSEYLWQNREIRRLYSGILDEPVPAHLQDLVQNSHTSLRIVPPVRIAITLAASALLLILTTGIPQKHWPAGRFGHSSTSGTSVSRTVAGSAMPATPARGILGWNAEKPEAVTLSVHPPKLMRYRLSPDELLLAVNGHDEASFSYVAPNGQELKFFVSIRRPYQLASPQIVNSENTTTVYWMDGPLACGLSGSMRPQELLPATAD